MKIHPSERGDAEADALFEFSPGRAAGIDDTTVPGFETLRQGETVGEAAGFAHPAPALPNDGFPRGFGDTDAVGRVRRGESPGSLEPVDAPEGQFLSGSVEAPVGEHVNAVEHLLGIRRRHRAVNVVGPGIVEVGNLHLRQITVFLGTHVEGFRSITVVV